MPIIDYNSDEEAKRDEANEKVQNYVELKKSLQQGDEEEPEEISGDPMGDNVHERFTVRHDYESGKVRGYESDYIPLSHPGNYEDTIGRFFS